MVTVITRSHLRDYGYSLSRERILTWEQISSVSRTVRFASAQTSPSTVESPEKVIYPSQNHPFQLTLCITRENSLSPLDSSSLPPSLSLSHLLSLLPFIFCVRLVLEEGNGKCECVHESDAFRSGKGTQPHTQRRFVQITEKPGETEKQLEGIPSIY